MAILPVSFDDVDFFSTFVNPSRQYISSSSGVTGSINLFPRASKIEKEITPLANFAESYTKDENLELFRLSLIENSKGLPPGSSFSDALQKYLNDVNDQNTSAKKKKKININRFTPGVDFAPNFLKKMIVKDNLIDFYKIEYPSLGWNYTNYNCLNFFTSPSVPTSSVLLYPMVQSPDGLEHQGYVTGSYALSGAFSFSFKINPRHKVDDIDLNHFKAGTIFHLSSSYALSLVTGSKKDENGLPTAFRLQLQLSHSADVAPSKAIPGNYPNDLIFLSDDNSINLNEWSDVIVRWGTNLINEGTGSFNINGEDKGNFCVPSGTIMPRQFTMSENPSVLCVGNFYEGRNYLNDSMSYFFSDVSSRRDGLQQLIDTVGMYDQPVNFSFNHPLKAEVHELLIQKKYVKDFEISSLNKKGLSKIDKSIHAFYVPPFFVPETRVRRYTQAASMGGTTFGGVLQTPFFEVDGSTDDPFNVAMAFGVNGHYINLENFTKDFANSVFPRLHHLSGTAITYTSLLKQANEFLYDDPFVRKRNLTILPCDNGNFEPDFYLLSKEAGYKYTNSFGQVDLSLISLEKLLNNSSLILSSIFDATEDSSSDLSLINQQLGATPENPGAEPGSSVLNQINYVNSLIDTTPEEYTPGVAKNMPLAIFQRTKDHSSNQVTFFDISNLFYGRRILPGTFKISDSSLSGSSEKISITLKDDGKGNIYRADSNTKNCEWNSVGNIFYNEGIIFIKSPHLYFFGKDQYEMSFKGEHQLHTSKYEVLAPASLLNSSSNYSYIKVENEISASTDITDNDTFVYISNINFHDENLNVIAKATLAQPAIKRENEKILFKVAFDW